MTDSPRGYPLPDGTDPMRGDTDDNLRTDIVNLGMAIDGDVSQLEQETATSLQEIQDTSALSHRIATAGYEGALGDQDGRPSWVQFDGQGLPTQGAVDGLAAAGVPHVEPDGQDGFRISDTDGNPSWLSAGADGGPDLVATMAIANAIHLYAGPEAPYVNPGNWIIWTQTDATGQPLNTYIGRN
ncbi:hypothetical protein [Zhihengliuella sp.]|uniref:hypothetical protein n=1 Tax=Zhihengliuella sp. TaxID=1954483 RepID=UPI002811A901|nr:hypothetical protein [Zhihengliuella sp.]